MPKYYCDQKNLCCADCHIEMTKGAANNTYISGKAWWSVFSSGIVSLSKHDNHWVDRRSVPSCGILVGNRSWVEHECSGVCMPLGAKLVRNLSNFFASSWLLRVVARTVSNLYSKILRIF
ncbi:hypothetical protein BKA56DRAFT_579437 [Ilyonectria sp. MPI-CAGE-AT-0026]|nr:hypothetical protein BKA56DRAFT_579437 [Ilyonectria sp. MPI-CAGE-AT-0026]